MRLSERQLQIIRQTVAEILGSGAEVHLFGSRAHDDRRGGDIDLMITLPEPVEHPAALAARIGAKLCRRLDGRRVDVLLSAPNLELQPIHRIARESGVRL